MVSPVAPGTGAGMNGGRIARSSELRSASGVADVKGSGKMSDLPGTRMTKRLLALATLFGAWGSVAAIRFDWTAAEVRCAATQGIDLNADPDPGSSNYVKRLAWLSALIVSGTVSEVLHDIKGAYATRVRIDVLALKKGQLPQGPLTVVLVSGPVYIPSRDVIADGTLVGEPSFVKGETVLLFLTKGTIATPDASSPSYELPENFYRLVNSSKFHVSGGTASLEGRGSGNYSVATSISQIEQVVAAQSAKCR